MAVKEDRLPSKTVAALALHPHFVRTWHGVLAPTWAANLRAIATALVR